jgi:hypothetical protein
MHISKLASFASQSIAQFVTGLKRSALVFWFFEIFFGWLLNSFDLYMHA